MNTSSLRNVILACGLAITVAAPLTTAAWADEHDDRGRMEREHRDRDRDYRDHERHDHYYAPPPVVYSAPQPTYYAPPPVVMAPPAGLNIVLPLNFR